MTMTQKQLKAIRRDRDIRKKRNARTNNLRENPMRVQGVSSSYRLYHI